MSDLLTRPATEAAGEVGLVEALYARIDALNPALCALAGTRREAALAEAAAAVDGPLHGVPVTVKEAVHVAGMPTTWGNPAFACPVSDWDATVVRRLRAAGAVIAGTTNPHEMLADFGQTVNPVYGRTRNPWDRARTPGGSSGGGAAAVAAGLSFLDIGSDLVGSVRIPAAFCGVYGLRPTPRTVPLRGLQPPGPPAPDSDMLWLSTLGPIARSAADLRLALRAIGGPDGPAAAAYRWSLPAPRHRTLAGFRVGVVLDHPAAPVDAEVGAVLSAAVDALAAAGATVREGWPDGVDPVVHGEAFGGQVEQFFAFAEPGGDLPPASVVTRHAERTAAEQAWAAYFADADVFLCPVGVGTAFPHDDRPFDERVLPGGQPYTDQVFWIAPPALAGLPALSAPAGLAASGLPVGLQVIGPAYEDDTVLMFAELLADVAGGYAVPPGTL